MITLKKIAEISLKHGFNSVFWLPNYLLELSQQLYQRFFMMGEDDPRLNKLFDSRRDLYPLYERYVPDESYIFSNPRYENIDKIRIHYYGVRFTYDRYSCIASLCEFFLFIATPVILKSFYSAGLLTSKEIFHYYLPGFYFLFGQLEIFNGCVFSHENPFRNFSDYILFPIRKLFNVDAKDSYGITDLHRAIFRADIVWVKKLLERGADVNVAATKNVVNLVPYTAVDLAASLNELQGGLAVYNTIMRHILSIPNLKKYEEFKTTLRETCNFPTELSRIVYEYAKKEVNTFKANTENGRYMLSLYIEKQRKEGWRLVEQEDLDAEEQIESKEDDISITVRGPF